MKIGKKIKLRRIELDMTQAELARKSRVNACSISNFEKRDSSMTLRSLTRLAKALKVEMKYFFEE